MSSDSAPEPELHGDRGDDPNSADRPVRVRQIPAAHAYVEHLRPVRETAYPQVVNLPDPPVPGAPPGQWWPHPALEDTWVAEHAAEQDLVHLHFGTEGRSTAQLASWVGMLRRAGLPLVHTVHDLWHPQVRDQRRHRAHLALLVEHADGLLTLTEGAAEQVERWYGRRPLVVPHPHIVPLDRMGMPRRPGSPRATGRPLRLRIGLHLKSLRTNLAPLRVLPALVEAVGELRSAGVDATLEVRAHPEVLEAERPRHDAALADTLRSWQPGAPDGVEVVVAPRLDDDALWDYLEGLDVSVLPYAWATHSGWVESCRDLGTWVLAPDVGFLVEQGRDAAAGGGAANRGTVLAWGDADQEPSVEVLVELLCTAATSPAPRVTPQERAAQRDQVAAMHETVYAAVLRGERVDADHAVGRGAAPLPATGLPGGPSGAKER